MTYVGYSTTIIHAANWPEEEKTTVSTCTYRNILYSRKILPLSPVKNLSGVCTHV